MSLTPLAILPLLHAITTFASPLAQNTNNPEDGGSGSIGGSSGSEEGASGADGSNYTLSKGGLIAIIVVVVTVAVIGIASTVLFVVAKRRQWQIRETLKRASRRVTARMSSSRPGSRSASRADRRGAVRMQSPSATKTRFTQAEKDGRNAEKRGGIQMTGMPPTPSGLRTEIKAPVPKERIEANGGSDSDTAGADGNKKWKAIMPPTWNIKGKA